MLQEAGYQRNSVLGAAGRLPQNIFLETRQIIIIIIIIITTQDEYSAKI
jgi:hypothetical protein